MKRIIILGASERALAIKRALEQTGQYTVEYFCDNSDTLQGQSYDNVSIISFEKLKNLLDDKSYEVVLCLADNDKAEIIDDIRSANISVKVCGISNRYRIESLSKANIADAMFDIDYTKPRMFYYEYHIADHCNLKCKGCGNYCNLITKERFGNFEQYKKDLKRLKELIWGVQRIRLMGGEPLLNPQLPEFIYETRAAFPDADIHVLTNGLLIPSLAGEVFQAMRESGVNFYISWYQTTDKILDRIRVKCWEEGVPMDLKGWPPGSPIQTFYTIFDPEGKNDRDKSLSICPAKTCRCLRDGKMATCAIPMLYLEYGHLSYKQMDIDENDIVDIYDERLDGFKLIERINTAMDCCRYCDPEHKIDFKWEGYYTKPLCII